MLDYYTAQTYPDAKNPDAAKALKAAGAGLDQIFQGYREARPGVLAHFWHGMATKQLGDKLTAEDIFDEVIAKTPSGGQVDPTEITFYTEAVRQKLLLLAEKQKIDDIIGEGESYLKFQRMRTDPWYGVAVEVAKAYVAKGLKLPQGNERKKIMTEAVGTLREATKKQSGYHREATALLSKYAPEVGQEASANTFNEAVSVADIAMQSGDPKGRSRATSRPWSSPRRRRRPTSIRPGVEIVRYQLANARYSAQDYEGPTPTAWPWPRGTRMPRSRRRRRSWRSSPLWQASGPRRTRRPRSRSSSMSSTTPFGRGRTGPRRMTPASLSGGSRRFRGTLRRRCRRSGR